MKKLVFLSIAALTFGLTSSPVSAQGISVELDFSYNTPGGDFADVYDGGVGITIHPRYNINDKMAVGLMFGADAFVGGDISGGSGPTTSIDAAGITAILGTLQYKLLDKKITPYGEIGIGSYKYTSGSASALAGGSFEDTSYFGFAPKVGAMLGFLNVYAAYIAAGDLKYTQFGLGFRFGSK